VIDRARLRELAAAARDAVAALDGMGDRPIAEQIALMRARNGALGALEAACTPHDITALLDALDAAERERDEARRHHAENTRLIEKERGRVIDTLRAERDALAALLQRARTALADMDRACDRDLIDAIDALDGAKEAT
jgi:predicted HD phosphohydrolase